MHIFVKYAVEFPRHAPRTLSTHLARAGTLTDLGVNEAYPDMYLSLDTAFIYSQTAVPC